MTQIETVTNANEWPDDVLELCSQDPLYLVPFRVYLILEKHGRVQSASVPYVHHMWFLPLILGYLFGKRLYGVITRAEPTVSGHVFCCSSGSAYRTEAFFELLDHFKDSDTDTTLFTVAEAKEKFCSSYDATGISIVSFGECFATVSPLSVVRSLRSLWTISEEMAQLVAVNSLRYRIIAFNFLVVEYIKYRSLDNAAKEIESFHTFAPMPYQLKAVSHEDIYAYQHGIEEDDGDRAMAIPKYAPITYFIWGDVWKDGFEAKAHPHSEIHSVGSPRYDNLVAKRGTQQQDIDVLFVSGSHFLSQEGADKNAYRQLVEMVVDLCEENGWDLRIKLHPIEGSDRYKQWGYDEYITHEESIEKLLLRSRVAVTDVSSAFVESISLGTPIVVTQTSTRMNLGSFNPPSGLAFPDTLSAASAEIQRLIGTRVSVTEVSESGFITMNGSCERIHQIVMKRTRKDGSVQ